MKDGYYPDENADGEGGLPAPKEDESKDSGSSIVIPISGFEDSKIGEVLKFKIVHIYEDELELEPVNKEKEPKKPESMDAEIDMEASKNDMMGE